MFRLESEEIVNDLAALVPETINVAFRTRGLGSPTSGFMTISVNLADLAITQFGSIAGSPWSRLFHRYEMATYSGGADPTNLTALTDLATQFATDWYKWQLASHSQYFVGSIEWVPEGLHDIEVEQSFGNITTFVKRGVFNPTEDLIYPSVAVAVAGSDSYNLGLTLTTITAKSGTLAGTGTVMLYTISIDNLGNRNFISTGIPSQVWNECGEIAVGRLVDITYEKKTQTPLVLDRCDFTDPIFGTTPCGLCESVQDTYCVAFPGLVNVPGIFDCPILANEITLTRVGTTCYWTGTVNSIVGSSLLTATAGMAINIDGIVLGLSISGTIGGAPFTRAATASYLGVSAGWDCNSSLTMSISEVAIPDLTLCSNWPSTVTLHPGPCSTPPPCAVTVSFSDADLAIDATTLTIAGTGFSTTPANNTVTLNMSAVGAVTAATSTALTVTFTTSPTGTGALTAIVAIPGCDSGSAVQVANVTNSGVGCSTAIDQTMGDIVTTDLAIGQNKWYRYPVDALTLYQVSLTNNNGNPLKNSLTVYQGETCGCSTLFIDTFAPGCQDATTGITGVGQKYLFISANGADILQNVTFSVTTGSCP